MEIEPGWNDVCEQEDIGFRARRARLKKEECTCGLPANPVGLALSGGGIRSATFSLGLMRSLSKQRLIHCIDYLSTVSGGGYAGAFYCSLFVPKERRGPAQDPVADSADAIADSGSPQATLVGNGDETLGCDVLGSEPGQAAVAQLRQGGHYLAPNGTSDALFAAVIALRNWFAIAITMGMALLALFFFINFAVVALGPVVGAIDNPGKEFLLAPDGYGVWQFVLIGLAFWPASCAWAYWFTRSTFVWKYRVTRLISMQSLVASLILILALMWPAPRIGLHGIFRDGIALLALLSFLVYGLAQFVSYRQDKKAGAKRRARDRVEALAEEDRVRNRLSRWLLRGVVTLLSVAALAFIYWMSREEVFMRMGRITEIVIDPAILGTTAGITALLIIATRLVFKRGGGFGMTRRRALLSRRVRQILALIFGSALLIAFVTFWATMAGGASRWIEAHAGLAWENITRFTGPGLQNLALELLDPPKTGLDSPESAALLLLLVTIKVTVIAYLIGNVDSLLNRSSFSTFYSGRLRSAYLGATNERRRKPPRDKTGSQPPATDNAVPLDRDDPNDEITLAAYYGKHCAPMHLINVTINETTSSSSRVIQRDRKGKSMTVAPSGYIYPPGSPSGPLVLLPRKSAEDLPLSSWMAISGAAFTTGAGHHTTLGTALLATLTNLRLGYWWRRASTGTWEWPLRGPKRLVQYYLLRELRASYQGTSDARWYLSDGGHYENTGTYELLRRRLPFIITSDNGADPFYEFGDLVNLIRKARIDFGTEIEFLDGAELDSLFVEPQLRVVFGSLDEIRHSGKQATKAQSDPDGKPPKAGPYATLARILYPELGKAGEPGYREATTGTLLLIKPRITGRELPDLVQYRDVNAAFPQQPTTNQFFDEAQWESYYRLGQLIGDMIFKKDRIPMGANVSRWYPWSLEPLPA